MKSIHFFITLIYITLHLTCFSQPFTAGNIVVYRVGTGSAALTTAAAAVFLDEYTPNGVLVRSIPMPIVKTGSNNILTARGLGGGRSEGMLNLSVDGKYLAVPGINTAPGGSGSTAAVIGLVDYNGNVNTSTAVTDFVENSNIPFSAISDDGNRLWFCAYGAIRYTTAGSSSSVLVSGPASQMNDFSIADGQLYVSGTDNPPSVYTLGNGLPVTTGQSLASLPGLSLSLTPMQFEFADLDPNVPGADVLYIADQGTPGGILKFSLSGGTWVSNGNVGTAADSYSSLTIKVSNNVVSIFAVRRGVNSNGIRGGELVKLTDNTGYNSALTGVPTVIASVATANTMAFRGVARVPLGCPSPASVQVPDVAANQANVSWKAPDSGNSGYEYAVSTSPIPPAAGTPTSNTTANVTGLVNGTTYYAYTRTVCASLNFSEWASVSFVTGCKPPPAPVLTVSISSTGAANIKWNKVFGASRYEYVVSTSATPPASGTAVTDTFVSAGSLSTLAQYYVHVRSDCGGGLFSSWTTKSFSTGCFAPTPNITMLSKNEGIYWNRISNTVSYEYAMTYSPSKPLSGTSTTDTFYLFNKMNEATSYYFYVRSVCSNGAVSDWGYSHFDTQGLQVYPNPVKAQLQIRLNGTTGAGGEIAIGDASGRIVYRLKMSSSTATVDTKAWAAGIYMVRYRDDQHQYTMRICKQ